MISAGLRFFSISLRARSAAMRCLRSESGCARKVRFQDSERTSARNAWYSRSSVHSASPCVRTVFFAEQFEHDRVVDEPRAARLREGGPEKEVAVAVHYEDARAAAGAFGKGRDDLRVEGIPDVVVARPVLEQVAEDVEIRGPEGALAEKLEKDLIDPRPAAREVEVGDEKDRHSSPTRPPPSR